MSHIFYAAKAWPILCDLAKSNKTIQYKYLAAKIGYSHWRPLRYALHLIQDYTRANQLPYLTINVVNLKGERGHGFDLDDPDKIEQEIKKVNDFDWSAIKNPFDQIVCPTCETSSNVIPIIYGMPGHELMEQYNEGEVMLGGCCIAPFDNNYHCKKCKTDFYKK